MSAKPMTIAAICVLAVATALDWYWVWGLLFIYWGALSVLSGSAFLIETIERENSPVLFWIIVAMWIGSGSWAVYSNLGPLVST